MLRTRLRLATAVAALAAGVSALLPLAAGGAHSPARAMTVTGAAHLPADNAQWG
ncbi:hypothetical protein ACWC5F_06440 [Streptomyces sp. NPDC001272]